MSIIHEGRIWLKLYPKNYPPGLQTLDVSAIDLSPPVNTQIRNVLINFLSASPSVAASTSKYDSSPDPSSLSLSSSST